MAGVARRKPAPFSLVPARCLLARRRHSFRSCDEAHRARLKKTVRLGGRRLIYQSRSTVARARITVPTTTAATTFIKSIIIIKSNKASPFSEAGSVEPTQESPVASRRRSLNAWFDRRHWKYYVVISAAWFSFRSQTRPYGW